MTGWDVLNLGAALFALVGIVAPIGISVVVVAYLAIYLLLDAVKAACGWKDQP